MIKRYLCLSFMLLGLGGFANGQICCSKTAGKQNTQTSTSHEKKRVYTLKAFKQSCCVNIVEYSLREQEGFLRLEADVKKQELTVWFDPDKSKEEAIRKAINQTGYTIED